MGVPHFENVAKTNVLASFVLMIFRNEGTSNVILMVLLILQLFLLFPKNENQWNTMKIISLFNQLRISDDVDFLTFLSIWFCEMFENRWFYVFFKHALVFVLFLFVFFGQYSKSAICYCEALVLLRFSLFFIENCFMCVFLAFPSKTCFI